MFHAGRTMAVTLVCLGVVGASCGDASPDAPTAAPRQATTAAPADTPPSTEPTVPWPSPRIHASNVVLYGGEMTSKYSGNLSNDVWLFDPSDEDWSRVAAPAAG